MEDIQALVEAIRARCRRDGWYAGELLSPSNVEGVTADDPRRVRFAYPPAHEEQLRATEVALGFSLPPFLRALYARLANGGFGPGAGLRGGIGGYGTPVHDDESDETVAGRYDFHRRTASPVDLAEYAASWRGGPADRPLLMLSAEVWPERLLPICDQGDVQESCIDCATGTLYRVGRRSAQDWVIVEEAPSLAAWLEGWIGESEQGALPLP